MILFARWATLGCQGTRRQWLKTSTKLIKAPSSPSNGLVRPSPPPSLSSPTVKDLPSLSSPHRQRSPLAHRFGQPTHSNLDDFSTRGCQLSTLLNQVRCLGFRYSADGNYHSWSSPLSRNDERRGLFMIFPCHLLFLLSLLVLPAALFV